MTLVCLSQVMTMILASLCLQVSVLSVLSQSATAPSLLTVLRTGVPVLAGILVFFLVELGLRSLRQGKGGHGHSKYSIAKFASCD